MNQYLYRVQIIEYPEGALIVDEHEPDAMNLNPDWQPPGWDPSPEWVERFGGVTGGAFFWPKTDREYRSRSSAVKLRRLVESYGATAIVQRSAPIIWPGHGQERVTDGAV
ncbi:hypothetical protein GV791_14650 [Nocardia cyriacigeorgica]|uniref:Uncharacterized protein n=1 Tax=Nocardia cyriacigeorgica TaxID=135487 RepID=A0A6P1CUI8_9NOCA|nr:hypothetical protein [Nocardia cyriacigeorgica]NEW33795.1 hypothetical protein [Nocardia cyriacigeorgica]